MAYPNAIYSVFSFVGFFLCVIIFPWHFEAWSIGVCMYLAWTGLACLNWFINSIIWDGNFVNSAPVWCDISTKYTIGVNVAVLACDLCIERRLYLITRKAKSNGSITRETKRWDVITDLCICVGIPVLAMILHYIPQGHRFNIYEDVGCFPDTYPTWVAFLLVICPPLAIACISTVYALFNIFFAIRHRAHFNEVLSSDSNISSAVYFRLIWLSAAEIIFSIPFSAWVLCNNIKQGNIPPWISWEDTHVDFSYVYQASAPVWRSNPLDCAAIEFTRWSVVVCAFFIFAFFGFSGEAKRNYRTVYWFICRPLVFLVNGFTFIKRPPHDADPSLSRSSRGIGTLRFRHTTTNRDVTVSGMITESFPANDAEVANNEEDTNSLTSKIETSPSHSPLNNQPAKNNQTNTSPIITPLAWWSMMP